MKSLKEVENSLPADFPKLWKEYYLDNYEQLLRIEQTGFNKHEINFLRNTNAYLMKLHLKMI